MGDEDEGEDQKGRDIDQEASWNGDGGDVYYDEINSFQTIHEVIAGVVIQAPANQLADICADRKDQESDAEDAEDRGAGVNLDKYAIHPFATCDATQRWMGWNAK